MICPALHSNNKYIQSKTSQTWCAIQKRVACIGSVLLCLQSPNSSFKTIRYSAYLVGRSVDKKAYVEMILTIINKENFFTWMTFNILIDLKSVSPNSR